MFCPVCKCEFRAGFARCEGCGVDLVEELESLETDSNQTAEPDIGCAGGMVDYCGFVSLEDARLARDQLRRERIDSEIAIRLPSISSSSTSPEEEYWLRVPLRTFPATARILGYDTCKDDQLLEEHAAFKCSECGNSVASAEVFCPRCGARFEEGS
jgi:hypothetical protein